MRKLQTGPELDGLRNVGIRVGSAHVYVNGNGETGPLDEQVAQMLLVRGGWVDVGTEEDLPHEDQHPGDEESLRPRRRARKGKGADSADEAASGEA